MWNLPGSPDGPEKALDAQKISDVKVQDDADSELLSSKAAVLLKNRRRWRLLEVILAAMKDHPILSSAGTSFVLGFLSASIGQRIEQGLWRRSMLFQAFTYAIVATPPFSLLWYSFLERLTKHSFLRTILDQIIFQPVMLSYSMTMVGLLQGQSLSACIESTRFNFWSTLVSGWTFWPLVQYLNQRAVPLHARVVVMNLVGFLWDMYYSVQCIKRGSADASSIVDTSVMIGDIKCNISEAAPTIIR
eukprot:TRINITY_DN40100_c0_g1_i1.p1 TRINITY_DN40100_c0_g1~~TRINITY_DN40100_c0_g1_i1.p1  ORF type:complete len:246 (-),score=17.67 TRINITY_DN40100_c0_g1_i1:83-820(-)